MKTRFLLLLTLFVFFLLIPIPIANACGGYPFHMDENLRGYTILNTNVLKNPRYQPFFMIAKSSASEYWHENKTKYTERDNIREWYKYFDRKPTQKDIKYIIYKTRIDDLIAIEQNKLSKNSKLRKNSLVKYLATQPTKRKLFLKYLRYAKSCSPLANNNLNNWRDENEDKGSPKALFKKGEENYKYCPDAFLKLRYAYQLVRLARYNLIDKDAEKVYEQYITKNRKVKYVNSIMHYWAKEHVAGVVGGAKGQYLFAQIFDKCRSRRFSSFQSFNVDSDEEWKAVLAHCRNNDEKAAVYLIRAIDPMANVTEELKMMYKLAPNSSKLEFLAVREVLKLERDILSKKAKHCLEASSRRKKGLQVYHDDYGDYELKDNKHDERLTDLIAFVRKVNREVKIHRTSFWTMIEGYLHYLDGDLARATRRFDSIKNKPNLPKEIKQQIAQFEFNVTVNQTRVLDDKKERAIFAQLTKIRPNYEVDTFVMAHMLDRYANVYQRQKDYGKAFLCHQDFRHLMVCMNENVVDDLLELVNKKRNPMEDYLLKRLKCYDRNNRNVSKISTKDYLLEMKGTMLLGQCRFKEAITTFEQMSWRARKYYWRFRLAHWNDPFNGLNGYKAKHYYSDVMINGYDVGRSPNHRSTSRTKLDFAKELYALELKTKSHPSYAINYYKLGVAAFNMTANGNMWRAADYWNSSNEYYEKEVMIYRNDWRLDNTKAKYYLGKALRRANTDNLKAKCYYMLSRCAETSKEDVEYIAKIRAEYSDTEYYKEMLRECRGL